MIKYLLILLFSIQATSQTSLTEGNIDELRDNFLIHRIKYFHSKDYINLLPKNGWKLKLDIEKTIDTFGINKDNWEYFIVKNNNFNLVKIEGKSKIVEESNYKDFTPIYYKLSRLSLIALNDKKELIYIGGNFFESYTVDYFNLSLKNMESFYNYLKAKLFNYKFENIEFCKKRRKYVLFEAFSNTLFSKVKIKIDRENYDNVTIIVDGDIIEIGNRD